MLNRLGRACLSALLILATLTPAPPSGSGASHGLNSAHPPAVPSAPWVMGDPGGLPGDGAPDAPEPLGAALLSGHQTAGAALGAPARWELPRDAASALCLRGFRSHASRAPPVLS